MRRSDTVAKRYASALFQLSSQRSDAEDIGKPEDVLEELESFLQAFKSNADIKKFLLSPIVSKEEKKAIVGDLQKVTPSILKFIRVLIDADRLEALEAIVAAFRHSFEESTGELSVELQTAHNFSGEAVEEIKSLLEAEWGRKIKFRMSKNPSLIGGFVARSTSKTFDASIRSQLENLRQKLA